MNQRHERVREHIKEIAAQFIAEVSNRTSLITVTDIDLSPDLKQGVVLVTVFPTDREAGAIDFLKRKRPELRDFVKKHANMKAIPFFDIALDEGEKSRQRIDELLQE
jgi:ribosome-binding factor A